MIIDNIMPKISVVVPIFGVESYIARCARSLFSQTLEDLEFIFINDCTQDRSIEILENVLKEEYPLRMQNVRIISTQENSGQAEARRIGIKYASGDYIINCDGDDWVEKEAYEEMYNFARSTKSEMVFCNYYETDGFTILEKKQTASWGNKKKLLGELISGKTKGSLCSVLIKRELFYNPQFTFPKGDMTEDITSIVQLVYFSNKVAYINKGFYYYYRNPCSITNTITKKMCVKRFQDSVINTLLMQKFFEGTSDPYKRDITLRKIDALSHLNPCLNKYEYLKLWRHTFSGLLHDVIVMQITRRVKVKYFITYLGLYPIWHKLRGYKFAL